MSKQICNEQGEIEENQKNLRTWLFEEESFVPLALFQDGKAYSIVTDHLGTPVEAYNEKGEEVWYRRLDMNGKVIEERSINYTSYKDYVKIPFLFQGQYYDEEIKLSYNRFRYYDPQMGRYISEDPIRFASGTIALFSYVSDTNGCLDLLGLSYSPGRKGRQERLKSLLNDDKLPKHVKGWIRQEINAINRKHKNKNGRIKKYIRNPKGYDLAHYRGMESAKGYDHRYSHLNYTSNHRLQHKYDGYGIKNKNIGEL